MTMSEHDTSNGNRIPRSEPRTVVYPDGSRNHVYDKMGQQVVLERGDKGSDFDLDNTHGLICVDLDASLSGGNRRKYYIDTEGSRAIIATQRADGTVVRRLIEGQDFDFLRDQVGAKPLTIGSRPDHLDGRKVLAVSAINTRGAGTSDVSAEAIGKQNPLVVYQKILMAQE